MKKMNESTVTPRSALATVEKMLAKSSKKMVALAHRYIVVLFRTTINPSLKGNNTFSTLESAST
jgi:hypothetical protein